MAEGKREKQRTAKKVKTGEPLDANCIAGCPPLVSCLGRRGPLGV